MRTLPDHPFYAGASLKWDGDSSFRIIKHGIKVRCDQRSGEPWRLVQELEPYTMQASVHGGLVDEAICWLNERARNDGGESADQANESMRSEFPATPDGLCIALLAKIEECTPGVLKDLCRKLGDYNMKTKEWKQ